MLLLPERCYDDYVNQSRPVALMTLRNLARHARLPPHAPRLHQFHLNSLPRRAAFICYPLFGTVTPVLRCSLPCHTGI